MQTQILEGVRLSPQQKHLWLLQQKNNNKQPYRSQCAVLIEGLKPAILKKALQNIVNRQEILRTNFKCLPDMEIPVQVITDCGILWKDECNLSDYTPCQQETELERNFSQILQLPFNFEQNSIVYASLLTLSPQKYVLIISLPALCADSATLRNLVREISNYYECLNGEELSHESIQYADIAEWQNELLEAEDTKIGREYWRKQDIFQFLDLHLPLENQQEVNSDFQPQIFSLTINPELTGRIVAFVREYNTSVAIFLLTCWQILLMRLTGQPDIVIGTAGDGRQYEELSSALGLLTKYLPLYCHLSESSQLQEIFNQNNKSIQEISEWQDSFNWELIKIANINNNIATPPFCFEFELLPASYSTANVSFSIYKQYVCTDRFKVKCSCWYQNDALIVDFYYDSNLFSAENIKSLAGEFETLLKSALNQPSATISELEILNPFELQQLLVEFNNTQVNYPKNKCIHQLFEEQVEKTPNKIAVTFNAQQLTYSELNTRANQLAHYLRQLGVTEVVVGICVERSLDMIVGILGILKAGGAYLPLDPKYPKERLAFLLSDTQTPVLLTQQHLVQNLPVHKAKTICLDTEWETIAQQNEANPITEVTDENLVYVIYTSGSTGKPKGVKITHRNLVHSTIARINYYQEPLTSFLLLSSFAFDSSVAGIFWTLCQGGTLFFPQEGGELDLPELIELIAENHISHTLSLPSLYALLLEQAQPEQLASLRTVIVAGEPCPKTLVMRHLELLPNTSLFNEYGPTEGTVWSSVYHCHTPELGTQVSIGRPITNTQIYLLDSHLHPVPLGVPGELYISGEGLAQGYFNCPDLTAQTFIPNPFSHKPGLRLYKTGDLARYLPGGNIEFLGRIDQQVKIRGFRIELSEIEAVLSQHSQVRSHSVITREDEPGNKRLVAYIVPQQGYSPATSELRHFLQEKLPEYMMPSAFVQLDSLPHLPNGKVDIKALPAPETVRADKSATFVAPRTPVEEAIAKILSEILGVEQVGIHDDFFELGGHSLLATQVISRLRQSLQVELPLRQFFDSPTVADLAVMVAQLAEQTDEAMLAEMLAELEAEEESQEVLVKEQTYE